MDALYLSNTPDRKASFQKTRVCLKVFLAVLILTHSLNSRADDTHPPALPNNGNDGTPVIDNTPTIPLPPPNPPPPVQQENARPIFGVYVGNNVKDVGTYEKWLGRPTDAILAYTGDASWADYEGSVGWAMGLWRPTDRRVVWSVAMIPKGTTLAEAAKGAYNDHWKSIATKLSAWHPDEKIIYIRTGWEFNGDWFHYNAIHKEAAFIGAWRQFVTTFRSVSLRFRFDWCPTGVSEMPMNAEDAYPGDDYVDIIGLDVYDQQRWCKIKDPVRRWNEVDLHGNHGLLWHQRFAQQHHKPMSYPEWGAGGADAGDDPYFIKQMHQWFIDNHVIYASYWDSNATYDGQLSGNQYPNAGDQYKELFGTTDPANPAPSSASLPLPRVDHAPARAASITPLPVRSE